MDINSTHNSYLQLNQEKIKVMDLQIHVSEKKITVAAYILSGKIVDCQHWFQIIVDSVFLIVIKNLWNSKKFQFILGLGYRIAHERHGRFGWLPNQVESTLAFQMG